MQAMYLQWINVYTHISIYEYDEELLSNIVFFLPMLMYLVKKFVVNLSVY